MSEQLTTFGDGRDINEDNEEIPEWARPYIRTLKGQVTALEAELKATHDETNFIARKHTEAINERDAAQERNDQLVQDGLQWVTIGNENDELRVKLAAAQERIEELEGSPRYVTRIEAAIQTEAGKARRAEQELVQAYSTIADMSEAGLKLVSEGNALRTAAVEAETALTEASRELNNIREKKCTCPHDYYHGDHHYTFCPASDKSKAASSHLTFPLNRVAYSLEGPALANLRRALGQRKEVAGE